MGLRQRLESMLSYHVKSGQIIPVPFFFERTARERGAVKSGRKYMETCKGSFLG